MARATDYDRPLAVTNPSQQEEPVSAETRRETESGYPIFAVGQDLADGSSPPHRAGGGLMPPVEVERIVALEKGLEAVTEDIHDIKKGVEKMNDRMGDALQVLADKLAGRPSWAVLAIFSVQLTAIGILATLVATGR